MVGFLAFQVVSTDTAVGGRPHFWQVMVNILTPLSLHAKGEGKGLSMWPLLRPFQWDCWGISLHICGVEVCAPHWAFANVGGLGTQCLLCFFLFHPVRLPFSRSASLPTKKLVIYGCEIWRSWMSICKIKLNRISYWEERKCTLKWIAVEIEIPWETPVIHSYSQPLLRFLR